MTQTEMELEQPINPRDIEFTELISLFRASDYINFQQFQTDLYNGLLEVHYE
jgi:hypothetical protein